jgi:hypothetical protein
MCRGTALRVPSWGVPVRGQADWDGTIRLLPVMDNHRLVGMISEAYLAAHFGQREVSEFASAVYSAPTRLSGCRHDSS